MDLDDPGQPDGEWWIDIRSDAFETSVSWKSGRGFGVYLDEPSYGEPPHEIYRNPVLAAIRVGQLAKAHEAGNDSRLSLAEVRKMLGKTQVELAQILRIAQANVSKLEARPNPSMESLRAVARALGGEIEIRLRLPDMNVPLAIPAAEEHPAP